MWNEDLISIVYFSLISVWERVGFMRLDKKAKIHSVFYDISS